MFDYFLLNSIDTKKLWKWSDVPFIDFFPFKEHDSSRQTGFDYEKRKHFMAVKCVKGVPFASNWRYEKAMKQRKMKWKNGNGFLVDAVITSVYRIAAGNLCSLFFRLFPIWFDIACYVFGFLFSILIS